MQRPSLVKHEDQLVKLRASLRSFSMAQRKRALTFLRLIVPKIKNLSPATRTALQTKADGQTNGTEVKERESAAKGRGGEWAVHLDAAYKFARSGKSPFDAEFTELLFFGSRLAPLTDAELDSLVAYAKELVNGPVS